MIILIIIEIVIMIIVCEIKMRKENAEIERLEKLSNDSRDKIEKENQMCYEDFINTPPGKDADGHIKWAREYFKLNNKNT